MNTAIDLVVDRRDNNVDLFVHNNTITITLFIEPSQLINLISLADRNRDGTAEIGGISATVMEDDWEDEE